jgi:hypothetical protein
MPWKPPPRLPEFRTADLSDDPHARTPEETEAMLRRVVGDEQARAAIRGKEWESRRDERKRKEEERKADERWMRDYASREGERQKRWEASKARHGP